MASSLAPASKDTPRTLRHVKTGDEVRCVDPGEYLTLTSAMGYRDVTDQGGGTSRRSSSRSGGASTSSKASDDASS